MQSIRICFSTLEYSRRQKKLSWPGDHRLCVHSTNSPLVEMLWNRCSRRSKSNVRPKHQVKTRLYYVQIESRLRNVLSLAFSSFLFDAQLDTCIDITNFYHKCVGKFILLDRNRIVKVNRTSQTITISSSYQTLPGLN